MACLEWLVGREHARTLLTDALETARSGAGGLVLLRGEPGIGKSALLAWATERAAPDFHVLRGFCWDSAGAPPYWLWTQVLRASGLQAVDLGVAALLLAPLEASWSARPGDTLAASDARFRLLDAVAHGVRELARSRPVLIAADDLHWADEASLEMLSFVARATAADPVLMVGSYREIEASPRVQALAADGREIPLTGMSRDEVTALVEAMPGQRLPPSMTSDLWERSGGNPFFVQELARLVQAEGVDRPPSHLPVGVVEAVRQRLARLPTDTVRLLDWAAVAGREIDVPLLVTAGATAQEATCFDLLAHARQVGVVTGGDTLRFAHDLYRQAIEGAQPALLTARINHEIARAMQARGRPGEAARVAAHLLKAGTALRDEAVEWSLRAAQEATARLGHGDACRHYERALELTDPSDPRRLQIVLDLSAALARTEGAESARQHYREAAALSRDRQDVERLAEVALGVQVLGQRSQAQFAEALDLLDEAAALLEAQVGSLTLRARLAAAKAVCLRHSRYGEADPAVREAADRAVALAEESGDPGARAAAQLALHDAIWTPGAAAERLVVADEMLSAARQAQAPDLIAQAQLLRATALVELGDPAGRDALLTYVRLAEALGHPRGRWGARTRQATYAQIAGRSEEAADLGEQALELGRSIEEPDALGVFFTHRYALVALGIAEPSGTLDDGDPMWPLRPLVSAWPHAARGDQDATAAVLGDFSVVDIPVATSLEAPAAAAVVFAVAGTEQQRQWIYDLLLPFTGTHVVVGGCASYHAAVDHHLGVLAASLGDRDAAESHLRTALVMHQRLGAAGWTRLTMKALDTLAAAVDNEFRREGDGWFLAYDGQQVRMADAKGLHDLWQIVGAHGADVHVMTLLGVAGQHLPTGSDPMLDAQAKAAYKARLTDLEAAIEDAEDGGDVARADAFRAERSAIIGELAAATGLGGRDRRLGAETERARKTVSARVRDSLSRIEHIHPTLAAHLRSSIRMGASCAYRPDVPLSWRLG